jgi:hypothetical protein
LQLDIEVAGTPLQVASGRLGHEYGVVHIQLETSQSNLGRMGPAATSAFAIS